MSDNAIGIVVGAAVLGVGGYFGYQWWQKNQVHAAETVDLTIAVRGQGTLMAAWGSDLAEIGPGTATVPRGTVITIGVADAPSGWHFDHWEGLATGTAPGVTLTLNASGTLTAVFVEDSVAGDRDPIAIVWS